MCIAPLTLDDGTEVACHECWQCCERRINDWVGRCTAEGKTSVEAWAVTLTYGRDSQGEKLHERAVVLTYSDVQKYLKLLRRHRYTVRYFCAGEFGGLKGRTHWHLVLFFGPRRPLKKRGRIVAGADMTPVPVRAGVNQYGRWVANAVAERFNHHRVDERGEAVEVDGKPAMWWPHGFAFWEPVHENSVRYACKYLLKVEDAEAQKSLAVSKKPPLGAAYFRGIAEQYVRQGLAPQDLFYRFPEVRRRKADGSEEVMEFMLMETSAKMFLEHYCRVWAETYPGREMPPSPLLEAWTEYGVLSLPESAARWIDFVDRRMTALDIPKPREPTVPVELLSEEDIERIKARSFRIMDMRDEADEARWDAAFQRKWKRMGLDGDGEERSQDEVERENREFIEAREREREAYLKSVGRAYVKGAIGAGFTGPAKRPDA